MKNLLYKVLGTKGCTYILYRTAIFVYVHIRFLRNYLCLYICEQYIYEQYICIVNFTCIRLTIIKSQMK